MLDIGRVTAIRSVVYVEAEISSSTDVINDDLELPPELKVGKTAPLGLSDVSAR